jgi:hypothetical protein
MKKNLLLIILFFSCITIFCKDKPNEYKYEIELTEVSKHDVLVVKVWTFNKKPNVSEDIAIRNAIHGVIFKGLEDSGKIKGRRPLVENYDDYKSYFDDFFKEKKYLEFGKIALNNYVEQGDVIKISREYKIGKTVVIAISNLRKHLENDNIIKGLSDGF